MSQEIRQRNTGSMNSTEPRSNDDSDDFFLGSRSGLSAPSLLKASPIQSGTVLKLHVPMVYGLSPTFIKQMLSSEWCLRMCESLRPQWKERQLVCLGKFLYRFSNEHSSSPKGSPIELDLIEAHFVNQESVEDDWYGIDIALQNLPPGCDGVFAVSTFGKTRYFAVSTKEEAMMWVHSLQQARQDSITRSMGHAKDVPYPKNWDYYDRLGASLKKRKERVKRSIESSNMREMEMTSMGEASSGMMPRSY